MTGKCLWDSRKGIESVTLGHSSSATTGACGSKSGGFEQLAAGVTCYLELAATPSKNQRHIKLLRSLTAQEGNAFGSHDSCC